MSQDNTSPKPPSNSRDPRDPRFYITTLPSIPAKFSGLLSDHSGIPQPDQHQHIQLLRNTAYERHPYPCLGRFRFLDLDLSVHPLYASELLPRLTAPSGSGEREPLFLDVGCCIGQDLRKLALDGVPTSRLYGADLVPEFVEVGYRLFRDEATFPRDHFFAPVDVLAGDGPGAGDGALSGLAGKVRVLHISAVFHLFERERQVLLARRCVELLDRGAGRCLVLGGDAAKVDAGEVVRADGRTRFRHNGESWRELWEEVARDVGVKVQVAHSMQATHPSVERVGTEEERRKVIGSEDEGFWWSTWSVWVDFSRSS